MKTSRQPGDLDERALLADVAFNRHSMNDGHHKSPFDNGTVQAGTDGIEVVLVQGIDQEKFRRTLSAATRATIGIDIGTRWEYCDDLAYTGRCAQGHTDHDRSADGAIMGLVDPLADNSDWEEMMKGGLQTALETQVIVFAVKGVSRTCTHQLVRSRRASFHQQSQRASYMGDEPEFRMPESIWRNPTVRDGWLHALHVAQMAYRLACNADISYQDARFILPEGTTNFIMLEYPVREFLNVYAYRACSMFQWEIVEVMRKCREVLIADSPWIEPYVKISCEKTKGALDYGPNDPSPGDPAKAAHHCTFQGWEEVEGQCDFPWARESNRSFRSDTHAIARRKPTEEKS